ncbi:MAG: hypothetical protein GYB68_15515 [Chloroflexi bacterium]|nr:hypothetical protein [Chloroflexota bacterium]
MGLFYFRKPNWRAAEEFDDQGEYAEAAHEPDKLTFGRLLVTLVILTVALAAAAGLILLLAQFQPIVP